MNTLKSQFQCILLKLAEDHGHVLISTTGRALVPAAHLEKGSRQPKKGDKVVGRVLELLPSQGRVRITLKRALVSSKLAVLSSLQVCCPRDKLGTQGGMVWGLRWRVGGR